MIASIPSMYDLIDQGINPRDFIQRLEPKSRLAVLSSWKFRARPGQRWVPGPELITDYECGRGYGKNFSAAENTCDASECPERWGGFAVIGGPDPRQVKRDCLTGPSGLFAAAERRAKAGIGPGINYTNWNDRVLRFEAIKGGGSSGLTVYWGASSDPKSFRGPNYGLAWLDEFGVWYHNIKDEQGTNAFQALIPAMRAGPDPKIIITQTPSRAPEVRELQRDAERPPCNHCANEYLKAKEKWRGEPGQEPWRLPSSPRELVHPLLRTRTTIPVRTCPVCQNEVVARVRLVTGSTLDNPHLAKAARQNAERALMSGTPAARAEFDPQGEKDAAPKGALVREEDIQKIHVEVLQDHYDRWSYSLQQLHSQESIVFVDPAVTSGDNSDDSGLIVSCRRTITTTEGHQFNQVVALQDGTVRPDEVQGAPSAVWAPRAYWLALYWNASKIVIETNQGGEEVLSSVRAKISNPPTEDEILNAIAKELKRPVNVRGQPSLIPTARRMQACAQRLQVESVHRQSNKTARWGWFGEGAARGEQAVASLPWLDGVRHWSPAINQGVNYEPPREGQRKSKEKKDRFDALIAAAQILLGVRETRGGEIKSTQGSSWMQTVDPATVFGR